MTDSPSSSSFSWEEAISFWSSSTLVSLSASFAFKSSSSFEDAAGVEELGTDLVVDLAIDGAPETVESLFFASATAPPIGRLSIGAERLLVDGAAGRVVVLEIAGLTTGLGLDALMDEACFRAAVADVAEIPRFSANVSDLAVGEWLAPVGARDVLLAVVEIGFVFSSPEPPMEEVDLWPELAEGGAVALLAGFRTVDPVIGRDGGLLKPPVDLAAGTYESQSANFDTSMAKKIGLNA